MRALVIEDDRKIAGFIARGLGAVDFEVEKCKSGERALQLLTREAFDVAILDLMLPELGLTVLRKLRALRADPPVIVLSAKRSVDNRVECLAAGADDYVTKPFAFAELLARVQAVLRRSSTAKIQATIVVDDLALDLRYVWQYEEGKKIRTVGALEIPPWIRPARQCRLAFFVAGPYLCLCERISATAVH